MAIKVIMPKQGLQMTEGTIIKWLKKEGDPVVSGIPLFEMETDKLNITIDAQDSGTLLKIVKEEGMVVPITETIAILGEPGEDISPLLGSADADAATTAPDAAPVGASAAPPPAPEAAPVALPAGQVLISPRAKRRAEEMGLDCAAIPASGPGGMIVERDVLAATTAPPKATPLAHRVAQQQGVELQSVQGSGPRGKITRGDVLAHGAWTAGSETLVPFTGMRRIIAERMKQSLMESAQATHRIAVDMSAAKELRASLKAADRAVSYNDLIALATVRALQEFPDMNAVFTPEGILRKHYINLGVAVAVEDGLLVPVVPNAHTLTLEGLAQAIRDLAARARARRLGADELSGGTFTVSNLGMYGLEEFTAIINQPESGILAVGAIADCPAAVDGQLAIRPMLRLTLSYDHRVVDGAPAARFLARIKQLLETPGLML